MRQTRRRGAAAVAAVTAVLMVATATVATAHPDLELPDDVKLSYATDGGSLQEEFRAAWRNALSDHTHQTVAASSVEKQGKAAAGTGHGALGNIAGGLSLAGHGERLAPDATTDVWAHDGYAYLGTFNSPCGDGTGDNGSGIRIFDVSNVANPVEVGHIPSVEGSRTNDVKIADMGDSTILVHSNESCDGGPGGFEIYEVSDPLAAVHLASVRIDEPNPISDSLFGGISDVGVHNLWLFSQGDEHYVSAVAETAFGNFHTYRITDPATPVLVSTWGAEEINDPGVGAELVDVSRVLAGALDVLAGYGQSQNKFLHDITINADGSRAFLSNWDAGLVLLDITDPSAPSLVSVAIDLDDGDGEVNSHSAWMSEDGTVVVEGEEDFSPFESSTFVEGVGPVDSVEGAITTPIVSLGSMSGGTVYVGLACDPASVPASTADGQLALIQRGVCAFTTKAQNALDAGYDGIVVFNDAARGDALVLMGGDPVDIPGIFVGHSDGLAIAGVGSADDLVIGDAGAFVDVTVTANQWSGLRVWDYSDEANPVLLSSINTECSADPLHPSCAEGGTYSSHNVQIEGDKVYVSWYSEGLLVFDISDPRAPVLDARFSRSGNGFFNTNAGPQDIWGVHKLEGEPYIYASDRNGGLYVLYDAEDCGAACGKGKRGR